MKCPNCHSTVSRSPFLIGRRAGRSFPCPACGTELKLELNPGRLLSMGLPAIGLAALMSYAIWKAGFAAVVPQYVISGLCVGLAILITNLMSWRVERR